MCVVRLSWFFFQICNRINKYQFPHNQNRYTPPRVSFSTYSGVVLWGRFNWFEDLNFFYKWFVLSSLISIPQPDQNFKQIKTSIYLASSPITWTSLNSNYLASNLLNVQLSIYQLFMKEKVQLSIQQPYIIHKKIMFIHGEWNKFHIFCKLVYVINLFIHTRIKPIQVFIHKTIQIYSYLINFIISFTM